METATKKTVTMLTAAAVLIAVAAMSLTAGTANAAPVDKFGGWAHIGSPGNPDDTHGDGYGSVDHEYQIAKHDVSIADWQEMVDDGYDLGGTNYDAHSNVGPDAPASNITRNDMGMYANWLTSGDPEQGVYNADGSGDRPGLADAIDTYGTVYALPTEDEWYKAAYYDVENGTYSDYAEGTDSVPTAGDGADDEWNYDDVLGDVRDVGRYGLEQNGTRNMEGNVWNLLENVNADDTIARRGGGYQLSENHFGAMNRSDKAPPGNDSRIGFRVVAIPEPASGLLFVLAGGLLWFVRGRRARA